MGVTVFGIRHHGPGCARSLRSALQTLRPDLVLVEGPPDADGQIPAVVQAGMVPPVALLVHRIDRPDRACFYPFALFSPEWQALRWAVENGVAARFCDLPCAVRLADAAEDGEAEPGGDDGAAAERHDPLQWLATADGYTDSERWWNDRIEETGDDAQLFAAILAAVGAVRAELALPESPATLRREAWMRRALQQAQKEGFGNIAFVCGAWHAPAMTDGTRTADDALLRGLPKTKVRATWTPWTHARLTAASGYGAGVGAPGWYEHLWHGGADLLPRWLVRAARLLRAQDLDASSAGVIEATRLCEALAGLRGRPRPGLPETLQAIAAVFARGETSWLQLLQRELLVGDRLGELPDGLARLPLEEDILATQRSLRLKPAAAITRLELDLREANGKARSVFLHRLAVLQLPWADKQEGDRGRGTFKEIWQLQWRPEFALAVVDASSHGNTVASAAGNRLLARAAVATLAELVALLDAALLADLPDAGTAVLAAVQARAAGTNDVDLLLAAIPPLCRVTRYGDVRQSDGEAVRGLVLGLAARVHAALPAAALGIDEEAAQQLTNHLRDHHRALDLLGDRTLLDEFAEALRRLDHGGGHPQPRGLSLRLRRDVGAADQDEVERTLARELSPGAPPLSAALWLDGFLTGTGAVLAHDPRLLAMLDGWVAGLGDEHFQNVLPLVRRTLATFAAGERTQVAMALRSLRPGAVVAAPPSTTLELDAARAAPAIAAVAALLGLDPGTPS